MEPTSTPGTEQSLEELSVSDSEHWQDGPPLEVFKRLRSECPVHWSEMNEFPEEAGYWGLHKAEHIREVSLDWETFSSQVGGCVGLTHGIPLELMNSMFIGMDPPKHDRIKRLFQRGFTPKRIAEHEDEIREITIRVLEGLEGRESCDLVTDVAQPAVSRVIGSFMGIPEDEDAEWAALMNTTLGAGDGNGDTFAEAPEIAVEALAEVFQRCKVMVEERRENPTDDLTSVLVHAEIEGEKLADEEIVMGFFLLVAAGNDSTKATYTSGMRALIEHPEQMKLLADDPSLIPGAVEECLRMFPAFAHFRRTTTRETEIGGQKIGAGEKVIMWYPSSNRDEDVYDDPDHFDVLRNPEHQAFGAGGRHFCLGTALARLELRLLFEETLKRFPAMTLDGEPEHVVSPFVNQMRTLPVRL
ncbi:MAG TPA: cytochrome P450 [Solirubrobacterales bacterium]|nr:cytochrome P450 [Solirubrobacterales bacterium]